MLILHRICDRKFAMTEIKDKIKLPDGFVGELKEQLGEQTALRLQVALDMSPEVSVRINCRKPATLDFDCPEDVPWCADGFYLSSRPRFTLDPLLHAGAYYVQDAASMVYQNIVASIVDEFAVDTESIFAADLCAAPGGKTTAMLNALPDGSTLLANEFVPARAKVLKENLVKYGYPDVVVTNADVSKLASMGPTFDIVAVDAPCSGEGMMRKEDMARSQWTPGLVAQCATLQRDILANAVELLRPGGYLVYSTCTFNTMENEDNAAWIAEELGMLPVSSDLSESFGIQPEAKGTVPCLRFLPGFTRGEGLFVAIFRKPGDRGSSSSRVKKKKDKSKKKKDAAKIDKSLISKASSWLTGEFEINALEDRLVAYTPGVADLISKLPEDVRILSAGVDVAEIKGRDLIPAHSLAMSVACTDAFPAISLSLEEAVAYLMRESVALAADAPKGYVLVKYHGLPLGFMKNLGSRSNNLYPQSWRILHR